MPVLRVNLIQAQDVIPAQSGQVRRQVTDFAVPVRQVDFHGKHDPPFANSVLSGPAA
jgi:hypothetical protein